MQDRFLVRIWDKERQEYHHGMEVFDYMRGLLNPDKYVMEQCTGLKDKNGELIYEGDICRIKGTYYDCDYHEYFEVDDIEIVESLEKFFGEAMVKGVYSALGCDNLQVEVIGNIHENPELLGDKTDE